MGTRPRYRDEVSAAGSIEPYFWPADFEQPIVLYDGPAALHRGELMIEGVGQLVFHWQRSPRIRWTIASNDRVVPQWLEGVNC